VKGKQKVASPAPGASWTKPDAYVAALVRMHSYRRARADKPRTQPVSPQPWLSTIPFAVILAVLAVIAVAVMFAAFPGTQPDPKPNKPVHEQGVASRGWFQEAQKDMHR
jgi:hypothetical protein